ncbi:ABC-F family ATP-binding cassette domain-containing protein [Oenococcus sp.]|uniref:ABC-F family ATP-binding cassette domain-containing protein n=1 Tax=Oenococcus sp. TaxID=1979414 RepID=UPI0039E8C913
MSLNITKLEKRVDGQQLFAVDKAFIENRARVGVIGDNGQGKTTLLNIIAGRDKDFSGQLHVSGSLAFVAQINDFDQLSGGQRVRRLIEEALLKRPDLLILDEPTTHLDQENVNWLLGRLKKFSGSVLAVSHDRYFLDQFAQEIWAFQDHQLTVFPSTLQNFLDTRAAQAESQAAAFKESRNKKKKLQQAENRVRGEAQRISNHSVRDPFHAKVAKQMFQVAKNLHRHMDNLNDVSKPFVQKKLKLRHPLHMAAGKNLIKILNLDVVRDGQTLVSDLTFSIAAGDKVALIGENGSGKTTSVERILRAQPPQVTRADNLKIGYSHQDLSQIRNDRNLLENVLDGSLENEQTARDFLGAFGIRRDKVFQKSGSLSGGEKIKLALIKVLLSDANLLILDEPTNFLDLSAIEALQDFLTDYTGGVLIISHDLTLIQAVSNKILKIEAQRIIEV